MAFAPRLSVVDTSSWALTPALAFCVLRLLRLAMSVLASVVSDGSPGSSLLMIGMTIVALAAFSAACELFRGRLLGGLGNSCEVAGFLCFIVVTSGTAEPAASSSEASRDDG